MTADTLRTFQLYEDFATIDFKDCFEVKDMTTLPTVSEARLLAVWTVLTTNTGGAESFSCNLTQSSLLQLSRSVVVIEGGLFKFEASREDLAKIGTVTGVVTGIASIPLVSSVKLERWFNREFVTTDVRVHGLQLMNLPAMFLHHPFDGRHHRYHCSCCNCRLH